MKTKLDTVRASRDGHEFHEAWAARKALQLVMPQDNFVAIAVEGLSPRDQQFTSKETDLIADLVFYYGSEARLNMARSIIILQLKYSIASKNVDFRMTDAKDTIRKFATAYKDFKKKKRTDKLAFQLITNRPIHTFFKKAVDALGTGNGASLKGTAKNQAEQFIEACKLHGKDLKLFAGKFNLTGLTGDLQYNKHQLSVVLGDWSAAQDVLARARLGNLRDLLRNKAGEAGVGQNVIRRVDVLAALEVQSPEELLPCPSSFPSVGPIVQRDQLNAAVAIIPRLQRPLLIHSDGGVGKTVFIQSLAKSLERKHEVILFDCFGGGDYRAPEDARHLPRRGFLQIVNHLACKGYCDPLLPNSDNLEQLVSAFRSRLAQTVSTLRKASRKRLLLIFIDAIDNAAIHARDQHEVAFPKVFLQSLAFGGPIDGVKVVLSCRTYRREIAKGDLPCEELELKPFSLANTAEYLRHRVVNLRQTEILVAQSRSRGNPRILEHLALSDRGLMDPSERNKRIPLDDLLQNRINSALEEAKSRGYKKTEIDSFLAGLSVLPPPVPTRDYAKVHGMDESFVRSFSADLAPLLEQTSHGIMFRDEPTETLVRKTYGENKPILDRLASNLLQFQRTSVYAATALPGLLEKIEDGRRLAALAFDDRLPSVITSRVGKHHIRYRRLRAAIRHCARNSEWDSLVRLLVELSTLAAANERGTEYVLDNPDLVVASNDIDATRRLFETQTRWPGTRLARLTIASVLSKDLNEASRHANGAVEWIAHFFDQDADYRREVGGPEPLDIGSIPLYLLAQNRPKDAVGYIKQWRNWYAYEIACEVFCLLETSAEGRSIKERTLSGLLSAIQLCPGAAAAALSCLDLPRDTQKRLIVEVSRACTRKKGNDQSSLTTQDGQKLQGGLLKIAAIALNMGLSVQAKGILKAVPLSRPHLYAFRDRPYEESAFLFVTQTVLRAISGGQSINEKMLLPLELAEIPAHLGSTKKGEDFANRLKAVLERRSQPGKNSKKNSDPLPAATKSNGDRFFSEQLGPLLGLCGSFRNFLCYKGPSADKCFLGLVRAWIKVKTRQEKYSDTRKLDPFFNALGRNILIFSLPLQSRLGPNAVKPFVTELFSDDLVPIDSYIQLVTLLAKRPPLHALAGEIALKAKSLIEREDDVILRANLYAQLGRAILPASRDEMGCYFRAGLEQLDAIGSGDYLFTNELLLFAAGIRGKELDERDFHRLMNICELNMSFDEDKFPWEAFGYGMSRAAGYRGLAKLGRWQDRDKITLDYTLLPYLTALVEHGKLSAQVAVCLLWLAEPVQYRGCDSALFAHTIAASRGQSSEKELTELINHFLMNNPGPHMSYHLRKLQEIADRQLPSSSQVRKYVHTAAPVFERLQRESIDNRNYSSSGTFYNTARRRALQRSDTRVLQRLIRNAPPADESAMCASIEALDNLSRGYELKAAFLKKIQPKVAYKNRTSYIQTLTRLKPLTFHSKIIALNECKRSWGSSSAAIEECFRSLDVPLLELHTNDLTEYGRLSRSHLKEMSEISGASLPDLARRLILALTSAYTPQESAVWLGLASILCTKANKGTAQAALQRLLNSDSAKLTEQVVDGTWRSGLYGNATVTEAASGLVWLMLGSSSAASRWRAAHSVRALARFGEWKVIKGIIEHFRSKSAGSYQAPELPFFFQHARLWLLIAVSRIALDHPKQIAKHAKWLQSVAFDKKKPHVLMRHFAAQALLCCSKANEIDLSPGIIRGLQHINASPLPAKKRNSAHDSNRFATRPKAKPEPKPEFYLDYDFEKYDVASLSRMFEVPKWKVHDAIVKRIREHDGNIKNMYNDDGRYVNLREKFSGMSSGNHTYGQQLGWHALFQVWGGFMTKHPVVIRPYDGDDPLNDCLERELLTRKDGLWLADGVDWSPISSQVILEEPRKEGLALTGDKKKILSLLHLRRTVGRDVVVAGDWASVDGIHIHILSGLVDTKNSVRLSKELSQEPPFQAWVPRVDGKDDDGTEYTHGSRPGFTPWIVSPTAHPHLDESDPFGVLAAEQRSFFSSVVTAPLPLTTTDTFRRCWVDTKGKLAAISDVWGRNPRYESDRWTYGSRLRCSAPYLRDVLLQLKADLVILVILRKDKKASGGERSKYWHTIAVVRITKQLKVHYYSGVINSLHESRF